MRIVKRCKKSVTVAVIATISFVALAGVASAGDRNLPGVPIVSRSQWDADETMKYANHYEYAKMIEASEEARKLLTQVQKHEQEEEAQKAKIARDYALQNFPHDILLDTTVTSENGNSLRRKHEYKYNKTKIIVHHTVNEMSKFLTENKVEGLMKAIYKDHAFKNGWGDVGYNFIISPGGIIYEGRSGGEGVVGAHATWNNQPSLGIALIGNFNNDQPTDAQINALVKLITALAAKYNIDPESKTDRHRKSNSYPYVDTFQNYTLVGHRDVGATACPGENLYKLLPAIRDRVEVNLKTGNYATQIEPSKAISSNSANSTNNTTPPKTTPPTLPTTKPNNIITLPTIYNTVKDSYAIRVRTTGVTMSLPRCQITKGEVALAGCMYRNGELIIGIRKKNSVMVPGTVRIKVASRGKELNYAVEVSREGAARSPGSAVSTKPATIATSMNNNSNAAVSSSSSEGLQMDTLKKKFAISIPSSSIKIALPTSSSDAPMLMKKNMAVLLYNASMQSSAWTITCNGGCSLSNAPFSSVTVSFSGGVLKVQKNGLVRNESILTLIADSGSTFTVKDALTQKQYGIYRGKLDILSQQIKKIDGNYVRQYALVNTLPLEQYLAGIAEASDAQPIEKTKVLALLTKAYALYYAGGSSSHPSIPKGVIYNSIDDPRFFQKYVGVTREQKTKNRPIALEATKDKYVVYNNILPILPYFHCSPGFTWAAHEKRGRKDTPYLQSVLDESGSACAGFEGHGVGLSGEGANKKAEKGESAEAILNYYYPGTVVQTIR